MEIRKNRKNSSILIELNLLFFRWYFYLEQKKYEKFLSFKLVLVILFFRSPKRKKMSIGISMWNDVCMICSVFSKVKKRLQRIRTNERKKISSCESPNKKIRFLNNYSRWMYVPN